VLLLWDDTPLTFTTARSATKQLENKNISALYMDIE
jgi:predicted amidophosphoribosyltransferase